MPGDRLPMRKIRDVLRLHATGFSRRRIAASLNIGDSSARNYICRAKLAGLVWPLPDDLSDVDLERRLFSAPVAPDRIEPPDWPVLHCELKRSGVTLSLLWEEYRAVHQDAIHNKIVSAKIAIHRPCSIAGNA